MRDFDPLPSLSGDINRVVLVGALCEAPEVCELSGDSFVCFLRLDCLWRSPTGIGRERQPAGRERGRQSAGLGHGRQPAGRERGRQSAGLGRERQPARRGGGRRSVNVLLVGGSAARVARYLYAGRRVVVDGSLQSARFDRADGREAEAVCVLARRVEFLGAAPAWVHRATGDGDGGGASLALERAFAAGFSEDIWL
jgi:single-stranded DNA-binding protein